MISTTTITTTLTQIKLQSASRYISLLL